MIMSWWKPLALVAILFAGAPAGSAAAQEALTPEALGQKVAERYGVEVLDIAETESNGRSVYIVTVMNPGGNYNGAFRVTRLMVDPMTGDLVSQFEQTPTGHTVAGGAGISTDGADGESIRRMTFGNGPGQGGG